jgi:ABC-2 type transport system ATP-binding protein
VIEVERLTKYYGQTRAIHDLTFRIESGHVAGFLGLNGAGKTTALKVLAGFLLPTAGAVRIDGVDLLASPEAVRGAIGYLPERPPLYPEMTIDGYLNWVARLRGLDKATAARRTGEVAERCDLTHRIHDPIGTLSLGYRKRVGIAQAIVHDPKLVILDEPISGLDPVQIVEMRGLVRGLRGDHTVLVSSHILSEVEETCDQLLLLGDGELRANGTEAELMGRVQQTLDYHLIVAGDTEAAQRAVAACPVVAAVKTTETGPRTRLSVTLNEDSPDQVAAAVVGAGLGLRLLEPDRNELEDVFVQLLGKEGAA